MSNRDSEPIFGNPLEFFGMLGDVFGQILREEEENRKWLAEQYPNGFTIEYTDGETREVNGFLREDD